jgi:hypothetical protein
VKVQISDLVVRTREVELPEHCPHCGDAVDADEAEVTLDWNYGETTLLGVTYPDGVPVPPAGYCCLSCGQLLAWGNQAVIDSPSRDVEQATVWSHGLDRLMKSPRVLKTRA